MSEPSPSGGVIAGRPPSEARAAAVPDVSRIHAPVMLATIVEMFAPALGGEAPSIYVDGTLGMGGHAEAVLRAYPHTRLIGIDRDPQALDLASRRLACFGDRVRLFEAVYDELPDVLAAADADEADGILLDLGLSSLQIDRVDRGFSYSHDAPLDMRMSRQDLTAAEVVNSYDVSRLTRVLRDYGEERFADRIARAIDHERAEAPFTTSARLVEVISGAIPAAARHTGGHPAKRTFQALRIEVNGELDALTNVVPQALDRLAVGGRFAVLAYHSLEDRIIKRAFQRACEDHVPAGVPVVPEQYRAEFESRTRGAMKPGDDEIVTNPRSASARFRMVERVRRVSR